MKKRNVLLSLFLILSLASCKVEVKNAEDVMLTKEDYGLTCLTPLMVEII